MPYKVFISSTFKDRDLAGDLTRRLREAGAKVFSIEETTASESIKAAIKRGLEEADEVIVLLTDHSVNNPNVMFELGAAFSLHKRVTPVVVGVEAHEIPPMLKHLHYIKYADLEDYISELAKRAEEAAMAKSALK